MEHLGQEPVEWWLARLGGGAAVAELPLRVKMGFLNAAGDLLQHLGHRLQPYLPEICSLLVCFLQSATLDEVPSPASFLPYSPLRLRGRV